MSRLPYQIGAMFFATTLIDTNGIGLTEHDIFQSHKHLTILISYVASDIINEK
jgi:hypothetical protein